MLRAAAALLIVASQLYACAQQQSSAQKIALASTPAHVLKDLDDQIDSLQTPAVMEYTAPGQHFKAREQLVVRRPASLRVEAMSPLGVALIVAADGGQVAVFDPGKNTLMRGPATAATLNRFARIPMTPQRAVRLLLGLAPDSAMLTFSPIAANTEGELNVLSFAQPTGAVDDLGFIGGHLMLVRERSAAGQLLYEIHYSDYRNIGAVLDFPCQIEASFPTAGTTVKFRYEQPNVDGEIPDATFVLSPGPSTKLMELSLWSSPIGAATSG